MVMTFRVSELQLLLGLTNQSKCGRKTELLHRALTLIERGVSVAVQLKIREIFRKYAPPQRAVLGSGYNVPGQQSNHQTFITIFPEYSVIICALLQIHTNDLADAVAASVS